MTDTTQRLMYIGPDIRGVARSGAVFMGGIPERLSKYAQEHKIINNLIVPVSGLVEAKKALNEEGTVESISYERLEKILKGEK